jgi:SAM-dependent methyltransferase
MKLHQHTVTFDGPAVRRYRALAHGPLQWMYRGLVRDLAPAVPRGATVLDVGAGTGLLLAQLARQRPDIAVIGVDISPDMVAVARATLAPFRARATVHIGDVARLPLGDGSVDLVVSSLSAHHWAEPAAAVPELARVLRPGGQAYIYDIRSAPFDTLVSVAQERSLFTGRPPQRSSVRLGWLPWPRLTRLVLSTAEDPPTADDPSTADDRAIGGDVRRSGPSSPSADHGTGCLALG